MRIAMVIDPYDHPFNGTVVSTRRFVTALAQRGIELRLLVIGGDGSESSANPLAGVERVEFPELRLPLVQPLIDRMRAPLARPVRARLREALDGCDLLHVQYPFFLGAHALTESRRLGIPTLASFHVQPENVLRNLGLPLRGLVPALYRLFRWVFYDRADLVLAPSAYAKRLLERQGVRAPLAVQSNGVPQGFFALNPSPAQEGAATAGRFRVLSVGRLAAEKDQATLLSAIAASRFADRIDLRLLGTGPRQGQLQAQADRLGLKAVIGPASDDELERALEQADLFVHCGLVELEGMSVLEAMAAGNTLLVAAETDSACPELVPEPGQQFLAGNPGQLAEQIDAWLAAPERRERQGAANRVSARAFAHDQCVDALLGHYRSLLSPKVE